MLWQIRSRVAAWQQGKAVTWLPVAGEGKKLPSKQYVARFVGRIISYVIGQKKVKSSRKTSGAPMHLMLFYGFLTLFIGTTLLAINTYSPVKFHKGAYYLVYEIILDTMGLAYLIGVGWAFFRRLSTTSMDIKKAALEPSNEQFFRQMVDGRRRPVSGNASDLMVLGLLFFLGLGGYLAEAARMGYRPEPFDWSGVVGHLLAPAFAGISLTTYKVIWWVHIVSVAVFFAILPKLRIRHIVMAIFSTGSAPDRQMAELVPIKLEEVEETGQIGATMAKDLSRWHLMSLDACMECGRCTEVCPAWKVGKVLNPKQLVQDVRGAMTSGTALAEAVTEEALWSCTTCNACVEACPVLIRHTDIIVDVRRNLVAEGKLSGPAAVMLRQTASTGNAWGQPQNTREDWMQGREIPLARDGVAFDYLFWVGCAGATDPGAVKTTQAVADLLTKAGVKFACLGKEEVCTGDAARRVGDEFLFQEKAEINVAAFKKYGVKKVVTTCPHCLNTLQNEYKGFGIELECYHHTQLLQQLISKDQLKAAKSATGSITFHDPCYLARGAGESEAPRALVADGTLAEPTNNGQKTLCCGAGGGRMWMEEPPNQRPGNNRAEELLATGAKTIAVGCPFCRIMIDASVKQVTDEEVRLVDLAELLQEANK